MCGWCVVGSGVWWMGGRGGVRLLPCCRGGGGVAQEEEAVVVGWMVGFHCPLLAGGLQCLLLVGRALGVVLEEGAVFWGLVVGGCDLFPCWL